MESPFGRESTLPHSPVAGCPGFSHAPRKQKEPCCVTVLDTIMYRILFLGCLFFDWPRRFIDLLCVFCALWNRRPRLGKWLFARQQMNPNRNSVRPVCILVRTRRPVREKEKNFCTAERHVALASMQKRCEYRSDTLGVEVGGLQRCVSKSNHKTDVRHKLTGLLSMLLRRCLPFLMCVLRAAESSGLSSSKLHRSSVETAMTAPQLSNSPQYYHQVSDMLHGDSNGHNLR